MAAERLQTDMYGSHGFAELLGQFEPPEAPAELAQAMERLRTVNGPAQRLAFALEEVVGSFCVGLARTPYHVHRFSGL